jgi:hypothetical protein
LPQPLQGPGGRGGHGMVEFQQACPITVLCTPLAGVRGGEHLSRPGLWLHPPTCSSAACHRSWGPADSTLQHRSPAKTAYRGRGRCLQEEQSGEHKARQPLLVVVNCLVAMAGCVCDANTSRRCKHVPRPPLLLPSHHHIPSTVWLYTTSRMTSMPAPCSSRTISLNSRAAARGPPPSAGQGCGTSRRHVQGEARGDHWE